MNRMRLCLILTASLTVSASSGVCQTPSGAGQISAGQISTGQISGSVQTADGKGVAKTTVGIHVRPTKLGDPFPPFNAVVLTGADGTFNLNGVPSATYAICPRPLDTTLIPPCNWGNEPKVTVAAGQKVVMRPIVLQTGAELYVRVNDPNGTRSQKEGKVAGASLFLGVRAASGHVVPIPLTATDGAGFDHRLTVPTATDLVIVAFSNAFSLLDSTGAAIGKNGLALTINIPAGKAQHSEVIHIR